MFHVFRDQRIFLAVILVAVYCLHIGKAQCALENRVYQPGDTFTHVCECAADRFTCRQVEDCNSSTTTPTTPVLVQQPIENCQEPIITITTVVYTIGRASGDVRLICEARGFPRPKITWTPLRDPRRFTTKGNGILIIKMFVSGDSRTYTCTAINQCGNDTVKTRLKIRVEDPPPTTPAPVRVPEEPIEGCEEPIITESYNVVRYTVGRDTGDVRLICKARGFPRPNITWTPLGAPRRFRTKCSGILIIKNPVPGDSRTYTCTATNECGNEAVSTTVIVDEEEPVAPPLVFCPPFQSFPNGDVDYNNENRAVGTHAEFYCDLGYELTGPPKAVCLANGEWNVTTPECLPSQTCPQPRHPENGKVIYRWPVNRPGNRVIYACNKGYSNTGASFQTCKENFKWSKKEPKCRRKIGRLPNCGDPGDIKDGFRRTVGSTVYYYCNQGYYISGIFFITCGRNGLWSDLPPTCEIEFEHLEDIERKFRRATDLDGDDGLPVDPLGSGQIAIPNSYVQLGFVLDKSGSVSNNDFRLGLEFIKEIVETFESKHSKVIVTIITYSKHAEVEANGINGSEIFQVVKSVRRKVYGPTATRRGLDMARDTLLVNRSNYYQCIPPRPLDKDYYTHLYPCPKCVKTGYRTLLFLITNGKSNWAGDPRKAAQCLKDNDVEIFSVGITSSVNIQELRDIASEPLSDHLHLIRSFDDALKMIKVEKKRFK
ncbi:sushi, von Willebrand factor type A, EGF and pentraxin domain-containing protein 1-like isoform X2 [Corticium candelabrum]|uniref:sushi, von Willebrand factor type A, EGF and pentraxin domain-containing protein 1-like isoform X2 n=1 Tax=Corticium candelabrum TaxID=121492 RepID=UPI002E2658F5|nr:sushi, von Willebrand factor type A, EGF and pentraxin domain-containing protein 1-like isoform X2 [Corticium candelabrum]